jgi:EAL domain-containing protein (putative c-di-GMP-specific phosphodiesterase class I)
LLATDLRRALEGGELVLHYQPQITLRSGPPGLEAMVRWVHPELGLIGPERILPLAEDAGLLPQLTDWMLDAGCAQLRDWCALGIGRIHLTLPLLSRQQLARNGGLVERLQARLRAVALAAGRLEVEVAEELLLADLATGGRGLAALKEAGARLALDGFGRGPMSLRALGAGVLDTIKLGREAHQGVLDDHHRAGVVRALVAFAKDLGLRVVVDGVDHHEQLAFLRRCGCDAVQAFMSCPPLPPDACTSWLRQAAGRRADAGVAASAARPSQAALPARAG